MFEKSQEQIMQHWKKDAPCQVSIVCTTYNQEQHLREALDSFLMQETDFPFEIIVHDDASTDNTQKIITAYCSRYPALITPILQSENQYSTYEEWRDNWLFQVIRKSNALLEDDGIACWNTHNVGKMKLIDDIVMYQESQGYKIDREFHNTSPARQSNQNTDKSKRNKDSTIIYKKDNDDS